MEPIFILKLILSFIVGSAWVTLATIVAEKYGSKMGGIITGLPSTALIALLFIGLTDSPLAVSQATTLMPLIGAVVYISMLIFLQLVRKINFWLALGSSLLVWFIISLGVFFTSFRNLWISLIILIITLLFAYYILEKVLKIKSESKKQIKYTWPMLLFRGSVTGMIVAIAVILAKISGPTLGGIFAMFPAAFVGTIIVTYLAHGKEFSSAVMKTAILSGASVIAFATSVRFLVIPLGLWLGVLISLLISWFVGYGVHLFAKNNMN